MAGYDFNRIEKKWQRYWAENKTFRQPNPGEETFEERPKSYILDMFPYPSGAGLHVGHPEGYTATDIVARYRRMKGYNVLHPMGYDAFGLPAEQYAVEHGVHPRETTEKNIANIERQIKMFGFSYDWSRRVATTDVAYYRWTQWIFLQMFNAWYDARADRARPIAELVEELQSGRLRVGADGGVTADRNSGTATYADLDEDRQRRVIDIHRLAYMAEVPVNWCPKLGTVLANEEVTAEGRSERGDYPVYRRALKQWMLRITAYADRLLDDLAMLDWPEPIKIMQRNWIGKSTGAEVDFPLASVGTDDWFARRGTDGFPARPEKGVIRVYTTRPDTLFGTTYMVLAPEHPLVGDITTPEQRDEVNVYVTDAVNRPELERMAEDKAKTGAFTGAFAINPVNRERIPIWIADYVMMGYGTGAIMAVPAHDERDHDFARQFNLPIRPILKPREDDDAWYFAAVPGKDFEALWNAFRNNPGDYPLLRGIGAGKTDSFSKAGETYDPNHDPGAVESIVDSPHNKRLHFVGPEGLPPFVSGPAAAALPRCVPDLDESLAFIHSGLIDGMPPAEGKQRITADLAERGTGRRAVNYKLRDWLFSRQRYWGEPFPIVHCETCGIVPLPEDRLPLTLPDMDDFRPDIGDDPDAPPKPPLGKAGDWVDTDCPACGGRARRELNTMPQWAGSCWYYLRYLDPENDERFCDPAVERYWMGDGESGGVDLYVGGAEHAVLHLLYARFWHKVLYDLGHVSTPEPFRKLFNQGMIRSFAYRDSRGVYISPDDVEQRDDGPCHRETGERLAESVEKMSKSLKNVVNPNEVIGEYGADTFRLYEMFMGPLDASKPWNTQDVPGAHRFLHRVWRMAAGNEDHPPLLEYPPSDPDGLEKQLHGLIKKVAEDIEAMKFNTAIAAMMAFLNAAFKAGGIGNDQAERFILVLAPFCPHIAEEVWRMLGHDGSLAGEPYPGYDENMLVEDTLELPVQVNGKLRGKIEVSADADENAVVAAALNDQTIAAHVEDREIVKKIVVPGRLINLVVK